MIRRLKKEEEEFRAEMASATDRVEKKMWQQKLKTIQDQRLELQRYLDAAPPPKLQQKIDSKRRSRAVCKAIHDLGGSVEFSELRTIAEEHGIPFHGIGSLCAAGYLSREATYRLTDKGQGFSNMELELSSADQDKEVL